VGSRKSQLALVQTNMVIDQLKSRFPSVEFQIVTMNTTGDNILDRALSKIGEKSLFTKELEMALASYEVDFVVHSLKDLPTTLPSGMAISCICRREDPSDAVVMHPKYHTHTLDTLPQGSIVGTSSLRRIAQLQQKYSHLKFESIRGNLNTRLRKLDEDDKFTAIILATAGLTRLNFAHRIEEKLSNELCMHAVGQGALAIEVRADDVKTRQLISSLNDKETVLCCLAERAFMKTLEGGCSVPIAVHSSVLNGKVHLTGGVFGLQNSKRIIATHSISCTSADRHDFVQNGDGIEFPSFCGILIDSLPVEELEVAEQTGIKLAEKLQDMGAKAILDEIRQQNIHF